MADQAPEPVYPTNTEPPVPGTEPPPAVLDEDYVSGDWIAQDGMELSGPTGGWKQVQLQGREVRAVSAIAPTPAAADFRLKLREN